MLHRYIMTFVFNKELTQKEQDLLFDVALDRLDKKLETCMLKDINTKEWVGIFKVINKR